MLIDILVIGVLAAFLIYRLRGVLGQRHGHEQKRSNPFMIGTEPVSKPSAWSRPVPSATVAEDAPHSLAKGLADIHRVDPAFDEKEFLRGAREAFRRIVTGFSGENLESLRDLVAAPVYDSLHQAVTERKAKGQQQEGTLVAIRDAEFVDARLESSQANVTVEFNSRQIRVLYGPDRHVLEGHPSKPEDVTDVWTFVRDVNSSNPNWRLVATSSV